MAEYTIEIAEIPRLSVLVCWATDGEHVILTRNGEPVARIVAITRAGKAALMAEDALRDWLRPEEEEAWKHLQGGAVRDGRRIGLGK
jgi:antitoxin (DNA-binding transcriptional repressor) of toxin-antitoxin stability system